MSEREAPRAQTAFADATLQNSSAFQHYLERIFASVDLDVGDIKTVLDLYCGNGLLTLGSVLAFPHAEVHAVDYHSVLVADARTHKRVIFHQGFVTDLLALGELPDSDIVIISDASRHHGFTAKSISLLLFLLKTVIITGSVKKLLCVGQKKRDTFRSKTVMAAGITDNYDIRVWQFS